MSQMPSGAQDQNQMRPFDGASVTLRGRVEKIIPSSANNGSEAIQIFIEGAEDLYREIRIQNLLQDIEGGVVALQLGSEVEITIKLRAGK